MNSDGKQHEVTKEEFSEAFGMNGERTKGDMVVVIDQEQDYPCITTFLKIEGSGKSGVFIAEMCGDFNSKPNAVYIRKAWNNHDQLVEALEILIESSVYTHFENPKCFHCEALNQAREALARLKKEG